MFYGDFNLKDIDWTDRHNKSASALSHSEGQMLIHIMNGHELASLLEKKKTYWV